MRISFTAKNKRIVKNEVSFLTLLVNVNRILGPSMVTTHFPLQLFHRTDKVEYAHRLK